jgi:hypothetical protein
MQEKGVPSMFKSSRLIISVSAVVLFSVAVWTGTGYVRGNNATSGADHVRWDIINVDIPITTVTPGGVAFASADATHTIKLTGSGTFVAPPNGGASGATTGGGTWETFVSGTSTGSGTYTAVGLSSWQFANYQAPGLIDLIGNTNQRANGNAILRIQYSDGTEGTLGIGCHGPGAPAGIQEGVIATKSYFTYWTAQFPSPTVNTNRTIFHVIR